MKQLLRKQIKANADETHQLGSNSIGDERKPMSSRDRKTSTKPLSLTTKEVREVETTNVESNSEHGESGGTGEPTFNPLCCQER